MEVPSWAKKSGYRGTPKPTVSALGAAKSPSKETQDAARLPTNTSMRTHFAAPPPETLKTKRFSNPSSMVPGRHAPRHPSEPLRMNIPHDPEHTAHPKTKVPEAATLKQTTTTRQEFHNQKPQKDAKEHEVDLETHKFEPRFKGKIDYTFPSSITFG